MTNLRSVKKILDMVVDKDISKNKLKFYQSVDLLKLINKFNMSVCKPINVSLACHFMLSKL